MSSLIFYSNPITKAIQARREKQERGLRSRSSSRERTPSPVAGARLARASASRRRTTSASSMGPPQRVRARSRSVERHDRSTQPTPPSARYARFGESSLR